MRFCFYIALLVVVFTSFSANAGGGYLFISPQRVYLNENYQTAQLHLVNKSDTKKTYKIRVVDYVMQENGTLKSVEESEYSAKKYIRYAPRQITLEPQQDQYIRLMLRFPKGVEDGEYHAHLEFNEIENAYDTSSEKKEIRPISGKKTSFSIGTVYNVAVPVFVKKGDTEGNARFINGTFHNDKNPYINLTFERKGNSSSYNTLNISYLKGEKTYDLSVPIKLSIYREVDKNTRKFILSPPNGIILEGGTIRATLTDKKQTIIDTFSIPVK